MITRIGDLNRIWIQNAERQARAFQGRASKIIGEPLETVVEAVAENSRLRKQVEDLNKEILGLREQVKQLKEQGANKAAPKAPPLTPVAQESKPEVEEDDSSKRFRLLELF